MSDTGLFESGQSPDVLSDVMRYPSCGSNSALDLLSGYCAVFAAALLYEFGYPTYATFDDDGNMVHAFGVDESDRYVDVRGKTYDDVLFFSEFSDEIDPYDLDIKPLQYDPKTMAEEYPDIYEMAQDMIGQYRAFYL